MPSRPAIIKQRDVTRILKGAKAAGIEMHIVIKGDEVHFVPGPAIKSDIPERSALAEWRAKRDARAAASKDVTAQEALRAKVEARMQADKEARPRKRPRRSTPYPSSSS